MGIDAEAIEKIVEISQAEIYETTDGRTLSTAPLHKLPLPDEPRYPTIGLCTLGGLVKFVADSMTVAGPHEAGMITVDATNVQFIGREQGVKRVGFERVVIPEGASVVQITAMRTAFFAGAHHLFSSIITMLSQDSEPTESDLKKMDLIHEELEQFLVEFKARHNLT